MVALGRRLVRHHGFAAAAIDGPVHGDRRTSPDGLPTLAFLEFSQLWAMDPGMTDHMVADWRTALDALQGLPEIGAGPVGWWGSVDGDDPRPAAGGGRAPDRGRGAGADGDDRADPGADRQ